MDVAVALRSISLVRQRLDVFEHDAISQLVSEQDDPEDVLVHVLEVTSRQAARVVERCRVLALDAPAASVLLDAFRSGDVGSGHVDAFAGAYRALEPELREAFLADTTAVDVAAALSPRRFAERLRLVAERHRRQRGLDLLSQQKRQNRLRTWRNASTGMWHLSGCFDPETAVRLSARIEAVVSQLAASGGAEPAPSDWCERADHLRAQALVAIFEGGTQGRGGKPELLVVVDTTKTNEFGEPVVDWGLPVELPLDALRRFIDTGPRVAMVDVASNGRLIDRTDALNLGRTTRLANRAQRRLLRGWHATCVVPACSVPFIRCQIHHVEWWRHGGTTDVANLAPVCSRHHHLIHEDGWVLTIDERRAVTVRRPDGVVMATGPPRDEVVRAA